MMMKLLLLICCLTLSVLCFSQDSTGADQYCEVTVYGRLTNRKITAMIDYGSGEDSGRYVIKNADGSKRIFASPASVLNFMAKQGWKLVTAYARNNEAFYTYYVMKKKAAPGDH